MTPYKFPFCLPIFSNIILSIFYSCPVHLPLFVLFLISICSSFPCFHFISSSLSPSHILLQIITTFASRVDISVCKAQVTIDILLSQYGLSLTPKEVVEDDTSGVKAVVAVIRRAAVLQRDVDRLGQILVTRTAPSVSNRHPKEEVNAMDASTKDEGMR